ncbi:hypothetical protein [Vibrio fluminensis]|uniref:hypothetical protein n=1 Tax=Vibrio fluminensis TaxID=2783614 RepID=UPI0018870661|nr:hypothetical protein [Vibrio fluminensis]
MNNPKIFLIAFLFACLMLTSVLLLKPKQTTQTIQATVTSQTLTQSLDGHRRYLNVITSEQSSMLVTSPAQTDCPQGSTVELDVESTLLQRDKSYRFKACYPKQPNQ